MRSQAAALRHARLLPEQQSARSLVHCFMCCTSAPFSPACITSIRYGVLVACDGSFKAYIEQQQRGGGWLCVHPVVPQRP